MTATETKAPGSAAVFWRYWTGSTISGLGTAVTSVALPLTAVEVVHASAVMVAVIAASEFIAWPVLGLPAGVLVSRLPLRGTQIVMDLVRAVAIGSIPVVAWTAALSSVQLVAVALVVGVANVVFSIGNSTMMPAIVSTEELTKRNSLNSATGGAVQMAGPGLGGLLVQVMGAAACMVTDSASYLLSAVLLRALPRPEKLPGSERGDSVHQQIKEGIAFITRHPVIRVCVADATFINFVGGGLMALVPLFLVRTLHEHSWVVGLVYAAEGVGSLTGASLTPRLTEAWGSARVCQRCAALMPAALVLLPLAFRGWGVVVFALGEVLFAGAVVPSSVVTRTHRHRVVPPELLPRVMATVRVVSWGAIPVGALVAGGVATIVGVRSALFVLAALAACAPLTLWSSVEMRRRVNLEDD